MLPLLIRNCELKKAYQIYLTDSIRITAENTSAPSAYYSGGKMGQYPQMRFADLLDPKPVETRTADDIIAKIRKGLREVK